MKQSFIQSLSLVASTLAKKFGISISFSGDRAYTDGEKNINLPASVLLVEPDKQDTAVMMIRGFLDHETAHIAFNDGLKAASSLTGITRAVWNILQDGRDEKKFSQMFPGAKENLSFVGRAILGEYDKSNLADVSTTLMQHLLHLSRKFAYGLFEREAQETGHALESHLGSALKSRIEQEAENGINALDTNGVIDSARRIVNLLAEFSSENSDSTSDGQSESNGSENPEGDSSSDPYAQAEDDDSERSTDASDSQGSDEDRVNPTSDDQSESNGSENPEGHSSSDDSRSNSDSQAEGDDSDRSSDLSAGQGSGEDSPRRDTDSNSYARNERDVSESSYADSPPCENAAGEPVKQATIRNNAKTILEDAFDDLPTMDSLLTKTLSKELPEQNGKTEVPKAVPCANAGRLSDELVLGTTVALRTRLLGLLQSEERKDTQIARRGRLADRYLYRLATDDHRMFTKSRQEKSKTIAVHLLVDTSSSMAHVAQSTNARNSEIALSAAQAFAHTVKAVPQINLGVTAFPGTYWNQMHTLLQQGERLPHNARWKLLPRGCTPMAEAIWYAIFQLLPAQAERKVLILLSDGKADDYERTALAIKKAKIAGIEIAAISLGYDYFQNLLGTGEYVVVNDAKAIASAYFRILENLLRMRRVRAA